MRLTKIFFICLFFLIHFEGFTQVRDTIPKDTIVTTKTKTSPNKESDDSLLDKIVDLSGENSKLKDNLENVKADNKKLKEKLKTEKEKVKTEKKEKEKLKKELNKGDKKALKAKIKALKRDKQRLTENKENLSKKVKELKEIKKEFSDSIKVLNKTLVKLKDVQVENQGLKKDTSRLNKKIKEKNEIIESQINTISEKEEKIGELERDKEEDIKKRVEEVNTLIANIKNFKITVSNSKRADLLSIISAMKERNVGDQRLIDAERLLQNLIKFCVTINDADNLLENNYDSEAIEDWTILINSLSKVNDYSENLKRSKLDLLKKYCTINNELLGKINLIKENYTSTGQMKRFVKLYDGGTYSAYSFLQSELSQLKNNPSYPTTIQNQSCN